MIASVAPSDLISPAYLDEQRRLHVEQAPYGHRGRKWAAEVNATIWLYQCRSMLDYGCGQGSLVASVKLSSHCKDFREYDPAIEGKDDLPVPADLVVCTDVMEHVEPTKIDAVLDHLSELASKVLFVVVALVETAKTLSDGQQAHILLRSADWWQAQFSRRGWTVARELHGSKPEKDWGAVLIREQGRAA